MTNQLSDIDANAKTISVAIETVRAYLVAIERSLQTSEVAIPASVKLVTREKDLAHDPKGAARTRTTCHLDYRLIEERWKIAVVELQEEWAKSTPTGEAQWRPTGEVATPIVQTTAETLLLAAPHVGKLLTAIAQRQDEIKEQVQVAVWSSVLDAITIGQTDLVEQLKDAESLLRGYRQRS